MIENSNNSNDELKCELVENEIFFSGDINNISAFEFCKIIRKQEIAKKDKIDKSQIIHFTTYGGQTTSGFKMYDILKKSILDTTIIIEGAVASSGCTIMCGANRVHMTKNSYIMLHEIYAYFDGEHHSNEISIIHHNAIMKKMIKIYNDKIRKNIVTKNWLASNKYLESNDALKLGFVDKII